NSRRADLPSLLNGQPHKERATHRIVGAVTAPGTYGRSLVTGKRKSRRRSRPISAPLNQSIHFIKKVASSEAFTLVNQFWPISTERSNYAQIKLQPKVLSALLILEKQQT
ncbi:hypothetical protein, partial [Pseudomonas sp. HMWF006]|uniref:hypothetical protein n=1 Tax=Pseudomonas sp. HMWF006 TaxID=2056843 RepID=UPI001C4714B3